MNIPRPLEGEVHLYTLHLAREAAELARLGQLLAADETARAGLLKNDSAKNRFIAGRGILREILGGYLYIEPADVLIATGEHGKPFLADCSNDLRFNLSHADDLLVLAVATGIEVGVDIEKVEADKPLVNMARLVFSSKEQEELLTLPTARLQTVAFYRCWVRKEACLKACGRGFSLPGNSFYISPLDEATSLTGIRCNDIFWHVLDLDVPHHYCAALAVENRIPTLPPLAFHVTAMQYPFR